MLSTDEYYQSNALVQARTKNYGIVEHRLFRLAIADLNPKLKNSIYYDNEFPTFHLSTEEVIKEFGEEKSDHRIYEKLLMAYRNMIQSYIEVGDPKHPNLFPIFHRIKFTIEDGLTIQFHNDMKPFLLDFADGNYTRCFLQLAFELSSKYSLILLELMLQYKGTKKNNVIERRVTPEELKFALDVKENTYTLINDFIKKVINPAIKEINEKTNYYINPEYKIERGRYKKIKAFTFTMILPKIAEESQPKIQHLKEDIPAIEGSAGLPIEKNIPVFEKELEQHKIKDLKETKKAKKKLDEYTKQEMKILKNLLDIKISKNTAVELVDNYGADPIRRAFDEMRKARNNGVSIENPAGFIIAKVPECVDDFDEEDIFRRVAEIEEEEWQENLRKEKERRDREKAEKARRDSEREARLKIRNSYDKAELENAINEIYFIYRENDKKFNEEIKYQMKQYGLTEVDIIKRGLKK